MVFIQYKFYIYVVVIKNYYSHSESLKTNEGIKNMFVDIKEANFNMIKELYKNIEIPDTQKTQNQWRNQIPSIIPKH